MQVVACPSCSVRLKVPPGTAGRFSCPKCGQALTIQTPAAPQNVAPQTMAPQTMGPQTMAPQPFASQPAAPMTPQFTAPQGFAPAPGFAAPRKAPTSADAVKPFLIKLGIGMGVLMVLLLLLAGLGFASQVLAVVAIGVAFMATLGLAFSGRIWMIVVAFQETATQGVLVLLVPYYWLFYLATRRQQCWRPLAVLASCLAPALLTLLMTGVFAARYDNGGGRPARRNTSFTQSRQNLVIERIRRSRETSPEAEVLQTSYHRVFILRNKIDPEAKAERALSQLPGYVAGSFQLSDDQRHCTFQFRGPRSLAPQYAMFIPHEAGITMSISPTFEEPAR